MSNKSRILAKAALVLLAAFLAACDSSQRRDAVSGTIEVDEAHVASRYGGRVEKLYADEGYVLRKGDPILDVDAAELRAQRGLAVAQIDTAKHDAEAADAQLDFLRADARRQAELLRTNAVSPNDAERSASAAKAQEKTVDAARQRIEQARAQLANIDAQLGEMRVFAPDNCVLEVLSVRLGDVLPANREVATLIYTQSIWVRVYVPETWLGRIHLGEKVRLRVDAWPGKDFEGEVEQINRQAEFTPRNVQTVDDRIRQVFGVKVRLKQDNDKLRAGMAADVFFADVPKKPE